MKRDPTNVELFDIAQSNSEHSRHWFFRGNIEIDGELMPNTLFGLVKEPWKVLLRWVAKHSVLLVRQNEMSGLLAVLGLWLRAMLADPFGACKESCTSQAAPVKTLSVPRAPFLPPLPHQLSFTPTGQPQQQRGGVQGQQQRDPWLPGEPAAAAAAGQPQPARASAAGLGPATDRRDAQLPLCGGAVPW
jgi:hypothetical protein